MRQAPLLRFALRVHPRPRTTNTTTSTPTPTYSHNPNPPQTAPQKTNATPHHNRNHGPQLRKSAFDALPLPRRASGRSWHNRHLTDAAPQTNNLDNIHPRVRKMARPSPQRNLPQSNKDPRRGALRLPNPRPQRRNQQAHARKTHVGVANKEPRRPELHARRSRAGRGGERGTRWR